MDNDQIISFNYANEVRKELTPKVDEKISNNTFFSILSLFVVILLAVFGYAFLQVNMTNERVQNLNDRFQTLVAEFSVIRSKIEHKK